MPASPTSEVDVSEQTEPEPPVNQWLLTITAEAEVVHADPEPEED